MFSIETFRTTIVKIIKIFYKYKIRFHLTGGITSIAYSEPRMTQDVDIVVDNKAIMAQLDSFLDSLRSSDFLFDEAAIRIASQKILDCLGQPSKPSPISPAAIGNYPQFQSDLISSDSDPACRGRRRERRCSRPVSASAWSASLRFFPDAVGLLLRQAS
jgi:hypothetical protein